MNNDVEIQRASTAFDIPDDKQLIHWVGHTLSTLVIDDVSVTIRLVDESEIAGLNGRYRGKSEATNVLSFPVGLPHGVPGNLLGDVLICAPLVGREARTYGFDRDARWCHMVVHGLLHLCGYEHQDDRQAEIMESLERQLLMDLGFDDPYRLPPAENKGSV